MFGPMIVNGRSLFPGRHADVFGDRDLPQLNRMKLVSLPKISTFDADSANFDEIPPSSASEGPTLSEVPAPVSSLASIISSPESTESMTGEPAYPCDKDSGVIMNGRQLIKIHHSFNVAPIPGIPDHTSPTLREKLESMAATSPPPSRDSAPKALPLTPTSAFIRAATSVSPMAPPLNFSFCCPGVQSVPPSTPLKSPAKGFPLVKSGKVVRSESPVFDKKLDGSCSARPVASQRPSLSTSRRNSIG